MSTNVIVHMDGMMAGYGLLAASALAAAIGIVAQTVGARRAEQRGGVDPGLLVRLARDRVYLLGFTAQVVAFALAFFAREWLPLYIVQAGSAAAVGLAALIGLAVLGWRVSGPEIGSLVVLVGGLLLLVAAAEPSTVDVTPPGLTWFTAAGLALCVAAAVPASRLTGARGAVALGAIAGVAFAIVAVCGRPLVSGGLLSLPFEPLAWLMVAAALVGQAAFAGALQRGSTTVAAASMDAVTVLVGSALGLTVLGDRVAPGRGWWVAAGLVLVVLSVLAMAVVGRSAPVKEEAATP